MLISHHHQSPQVDTTAYIAPNAVLCGSVTIGKGSRIMFGAQIIGENASITIGENVIVLENAVIRGTQGYPVNIGNHCLIGPNTHLAGCRIEDHVFVATGASIFHGAHVKSGSEIRINGVVHIKTYLEENSTVPIGWIAVGNPMQLFSPEQHDLIWQIQKELNFPETVYGLERSSDSSFLMSSICNTMSERLSSHHDDRILSD